MRRQELGICFQCDEKYGRGHVCRLRHPNVMLYLEGEGIAEVTEDAMEATTAREAPEGSKEQETANHVTEVREEGLGLSVHSMVGMTQWRAMKLMGKLMNLDVLVLIDSGATHNFVSEAVIEKLGISIDCSRKFTIAV